MGVLDAVLQMRATEQAQKKAQSDSIFQAVQLFQQARQQAQANRLAELTMQRTLEQDKRLEKEDESQALLREAQTKQLLASANFLENNATPGAAITPEALQEAGIPQEDIQLTPQTFSYKGVQKTKLVPELKKQVSQAELSNINQIDSTISDLSKNMQTLEKYKISAGPSYESSNLPGADIYAQFTKSPEFNSWKADTGRAFQKYRKWATGVAAGYPELQMLAPNFPKATDKNDVYTAKSESAINDMQRNRDMFLEHLSRAGYRTGELKKKETVSPKTDNSFTDEKRARLEELRKKKAEGKLGK